MQTLEGGVINGCTVDNAEVARRRDPAARGFTAIEIIFGLLGVILRGRASCEGRNHESLHRRRQSFLTCRAQNGPVEIISYSSSAIFDGGNEKHSEIAGRALWFRGKQT